MAILVTGCAGFIGMHTAKALLDRGERVIGIDNCNAYYDVALKEARLANLEAAGGDFRFHRLDFADQAALDAALGGAEIDRIVHLGAQAGVRYSLIDPASYSRSNLVGHGNLVELARQRGVRHFVYASSSSVYGAVDSLPMRVGQNVDRPVSLYAATKRANELVSESYSHLFALPATGLRFFTVYGPWGRPDMALWLFTRALFAGDNLPIYNHGRMRRDFTYIDDIVAGVLLALDHPPAADGSVKPGGSVAPHAIYNLGNSRSEELGRIVSLLEKATERTAEREYLPLQPGDVIDTYADIEPIATDLGFRPTTTVDEGIARFVDWYRDYHRV